MFYFIHFAVAHHVLFTIALYFIYSFHLSELEGLFILRERYIILFLIMCSFSIHDSDCQIPLEVARLSVSTERTGKLPDLSIHTLHSEVISKFQ